MGDRERGAGEGGTRYRHTNASGGSQDQGERKDEDWESRQGGRQSEQPGRRSGRDQQGRGVDQGGKLGGTNTQGGLGGIRDAIDAEADRDEMSDDEREARRLEAERRADPRVSEGTPEHPRHAPMPAGAQTSDDRGSGAGGFDRGVDASQVGAPYQGARREDPSRAAQPEQSTAERA